MRGRRADRSAGSRWVDRTSSASAVLVAAVLARCLVETRRRWRHRRARRGAPRIRRRRQRRTRPPRPATAGRGDVDIRWYCCLGGGDAPEQVEVEQAGRGGVQRRASEHPPDLRGRTVRGRARCPRGPDRLGQRARISSARSGSAAPNAFHGQWLDLQPLIDKHRLRHEPVPREHVSTLQRRRRGPGRHPVRGLSLGPVLPEEPVRGGGSRGAAARVERHSTRCPTARRSTGTTTRPARSRCS